MQQTEPLSALVQIKPKAQVGPPAEISQSGVPAPLHEVDGYTAEESTVERYLARARKLIA
jgi:hypothetical protein